MNTLYGVNSKQNWTDHAYDHAYDHVGAGKVSYSIMKILFAFGHHGLKVFPVRLGSIFL